MLSFCIKIFVVVLTLLTTACTRPYERDENEIIGETYVHQYGVEVPQQQWDTSGQQGQVKTMLNNGVTMTRSYKEGILDGPATYTFPHSNVIEKTHHYSQGSLYKETFNFPTGVPYQEVSYLNPNEKVVKTWYEDGMPQSVETWQKEASSQENNEYGFLSEGEYYNLNHQIDSRIDNGEGIRTMRDNFGQLISTESFQSGQLAEKKLYYPNEAPREITTFQNGLPHGLRKTFYSQGEPNKVEELSEGKLHGLVTTYKNGERVVETSYVNGLKNGVEKHYKEGDIIVEETSWLADQKHGQANSYRGDAVTTEWYYRGKPVTKDNFELMSSPSQFR